MIGKTLQGQYAGIITRFAGLFLDIVIVGAAVFVLTWTYDTTFSFFRIPVGECPPQGTGSALGRIACVSASVVLVALVSLMTPIYFLFFWELSGQTLGQALVGVRVVRLNGKPMDLVTALRRLIGYAVCIATLGVGFLWVLIDDKRQGWHDKLAGTCVLYSWPAWQNEALLQRVRHALSRQ